MIWPYILLYGSLMAFLGALLITWAVPHAQTALARRQLYARAYDAAALSLTRWGLGYGHIHDLARAVARSFVKRAHEIGFPAAHDELTAWIDRAKHTNNLLELPPNEALAEIKTFWLQRMAWRVKPMRARN